MRFPRIKAEGQSFYHCVSRVVDRQFIFQTADHGSPEAERFVLLMRRLEAFSGVRVLTYSLMSNHFHLLCEVPQAQELSEAELLERIQAGYGPARRQALDQQLAHLRQEPDGADQIQRLLQPYRNRLFDLSIFIKELKGRFAERYNRRHGRYGVLWAERFKCVLLEGGEALAAVAAYIELNPVRAGLLCRSQRLSSLRLCRGARQGFFPGPPGYQSCSGPLRCHLLERSQRAVSQVPLCARKLEHQNQPACL